MPEILDRLFEIEEAVDEINVKLEDLETGSTEHVAFLSRRGDLDRESAAKLVKLWELGLIKPIEFDIAPQASKSH